MTPRQIKNLVVSGIAAILLLIGCTIVAEFTFIEGNQIGVKETWSDGVEDKTYNSGMYYMFPGWSQTMYKYTLSPQIFVMNNKKDDERAGGSCPIR